MKNDATPLNVAEKTIAVVTVFSEREVLLASLLARSLALYADGAIIDEIVFIDTSADLAVGKSLYRTFIEPELQQLASKARYLSCTDLGLIRQPDDDPNVVTQVLRVEIARQITSPYYLVLDASSHLLRPLGLTELFAPDGRPLSHWVKLAGHQRNCLSRSLSLFDLSLGKIESTLPAAAPYLLVTPVVRDLLDAVTERTGADILTYLRGDGRSTEFILYCAFVLKQYGFEALYSMGARPFNTLYVKWPQETSLVLKAIADAQKPHIYAFGINGLRFCQLTEEMIDRIIDLWTSAKLFDSREKAREFMNRNRNIFPSSEPDFYTKAHVQHDVLVGRSGRLFIANGTNAVLDQHLGVRTLSGTEVDAWCRTIDDRIAYCASVGAEYALLVAPDTHSIHVEDIPELASTSNPRPIARILERQADNPRFCYPLEVLRQASREHVVCHTVDSHWSAYAAWVCYEALRQRVPFPLVQLSPDAVKLTEARGFGDLGNRFTPALEGVFTECVVRNAGARSVWNNGINNRGFMSYWKNKRTDLPRAVLFMDSYGWKFQRFIAESFSSMVVVHSPLCEKTPIELYKPDVVINLMAERFMIRVPNDKTDTPAMVTARTKQPSVCYPDIRAL